MKVYISGKITGLDKKDVEQKFSEAADMINKSGHVAVNPCAEVPFNDTSTWQDYMVEDIRLLLDCEAIFMMDNWRDSKGAKIEHAIAENLGLKMFYANNYI